MSGFADPINDVEVNQEEEQQEEVESTRPAILRQGFPVPAELIGFIIGKGGANIQQIERASSARLSTKDDNGPQSFEREWVYVTISGSGREVDRAKKLLLLTCLEAKAKSSGGNGRGNHSRGRGGGRGGYRGNNRGGYRGRGNGRGRGRGGYRGRGRGRGGYNNNNNNNQ
jgi:hypothetical protein|tara:strand:- start:32 stop:541 length:510 start_codon:yes stop_codon:yes gene_type:complete